MCNFSAVSATPCDSRIIPKIKVFKNLDAVVGNIP